MEALGSLSRGHKRKFRWKLDMGREKQKVQAELWGVLAHFCRKCGELWNQFLFLSRKKSWAEGMEERADGDGPE